MNYDIIILKCLHLRFSFCNQLFLAELPGSRDKTSPNPVRQLRVLRIQRILVILHIHPKASLTWSWSGTRWTMFSGWAASTCSPSTSKPPSSSVRQSGTIHGQGHLFNVCFVCLFNVYLPKENDHFWLQTVTIYLCL